MSKRQKTHVLRIIYIPDILFAADPMMNRNSQINDTAANEKGSGSGVNSIALENGTATVNRSRKDYIIAIEDNAPMDEGVDPLFQSLQRLAKRTRGKMAVMDYASNQRGYELPFDTRLGFRNEIANDNNDEYDDENDNDNDEVADDQNDYNGYNEEFYSRLGGKQRLIGANVIKNLLGLKLAMDEERPRMKDDVQRTEEISFDDKRKDFAPPVVYEIKGNERDNFADYADDDDDDETDAYSKPQEPIFLFGNDRK